MPDIMLTEATHAYDEIFQSYVGRITMMSGCEGEEWLKLFPAYLQTDTAPIEVLPYLGVRLRVRPQFNDIAFQSISTHIDFKIGDSVKFYFGDKTFFNVPLYHKPFKHKTKFSGIFELQSYSAISDTQLVRLAKTGIERVVFCSGAERSEYTFPAFEDNAQYSDYEQGCKLLKKMAMQLCLSKYMICKQQGMPVNDSVLTEIG